MAVTIVGVSPPELTMGERPMADMTMAIGVMPPVAPGMEACMLGPNYWILNVSLSGRPR